MQISVISIKQIANYADAQLGKAAFEGPVRQRLEQDVEGAVTKILTDALRELLFILLSSIEQESLMREISFGPGDEWVALLYRTKIDRYHTQGKASMSVDVAESAPADSAVPAAASPIVHLDALEGRCALAGNLDLQATRAETQYYAHDFRGAASICRSILKLDPHQLTCLPVYLCTLHELKEKTELFYQAHTLIEDHPQAAVSWFAVGCYYHLTGNFDSSRRYFEKATHLDNWQSPPPPRDKPCDVWGGGGGVRGDGTAAATALALALALVLALARALAL